jgi:hypothetical protein
MSAHPRGRIVGWILLALVGLAVAVALSVTASTLSTQPIGLSSEPLRPGDRLAPSAAVALPKRRQNPGRARRKPRTTSTGTSTSPVTPVPPTDDHGGGPVRGGSGDGDADSDD